MHTLCFTSLKFKNRQNEAVAIETGIVFTLWGRECLETIGQVVPLCYYKIVIDIFMTHVYANQSIIIYLG